MVYPGATDSIYNPRRNALSYHVKVQFPATAAIEWVSRNLQKAGWKPLDYDFLNPQAQYSGMHSWQYFLDGMHDPILCVHQWLGDWKDASGNIVAYAFRYRERPDCGTDDLTELEVGAWYTSADVARQMPQKIEQLKKEHNLK